VTLILKQLFKLFKLLNSDKAVNQIAAGVALGMVLGLSPLLSLQALLVLVCLFFFRVQLGSAFIATFFAKMIAYLFDPLFHVLGSAILGIDFLAPVYTYLYNLPLLPLTRFYNSIVMGAGVVSLLAAPFVYFLSKWLIERYRKSVVERFQDTKAWKWWKATSIYSWYNRYDKLFG
jgi:uncharacterized protein (TIGR03546 family)